jgi:GxxExxY protein
MATNYKVNKDKVLFADESFLIAGVCFYVQNRLGRFAKEKQYVDIMASRLDELKVPYRRELTAGCTGNRVDIVIFNKILFEAKAKPFLTQEDFFQVQRYLKILNLDLGLLVNFWARSAQPRRVLRKDSLSFADSFIR